MLLIEGIRPKRRMFGRELFASDRGGEYHDEEEGTGFQADLLCPGRLTYLFPLIRTTGEPDRDGIQGAEVLPDGTVRFRLLAPKAGSVVIDQFCGSTTTMTVSRRKSW